MKEGTSHKFAELAVRVAGYGTSPLVLSRLIPQFSRQGEFIIVSGRGTNSLVTYGMTDEILVPETEKTIIIHCRQLYKQIVTEDRDTNPEEKWEELQPPEEGISFAFDWFKYRKKHERLKLELEETNSRCWLCSSTNPVFLQRFRWMLVTMFQREHNERLTGLKRYRKRIFTGHF
jgi:hypothetical protein